MLTVSGRIIADGHSVISLRESGQNDKEGKYCLCDTWIGGTSPIIDAVTAEIAKLDRLPQANQPIRLSFQATTRDVMGDGLPRTISYTVELRKRDPLLLVKGTEKRQEVIAEYQLDLISPRPGYDEAVSTISLKTGSGDSTRAAF